MLLEEELAVDQVDGYYFSGVSNIKPFRISVGVAGSKEESSCIWFVLTGKKGQESEKAIFD